MNGTPRSQRDGRADMLVLSDIDGLYTADPAEQARHIPLITRSARRSGDTAAPPGRLRRMVTKLAAALIAMGAGCPLIAGCPRGRSARRDRGWRARPASSAHAEPRSARRAWIAGAVNPAGASSSMTARRTRCAGAKALPARSAIGGASSAAIASFERRRNRGGRGLSAY